MEGRAPGDVRQEQQREDRTMSHNELQLYAVICSNCERPTVATGIEVRPDLCHPCFMETGDAR